MTFEQIIAFAAGMAFWTALPGPGLAFVVSRALFLFPSLREAQTPFSFPAALSVLPAPAQALMSVAGKDATQEFWSLHRGAFFLMCGVCLGRRRDACHRPLVRLRSATQHVQVLAHER